MQGIAARIASLAAASEILVSRTVKGPGCGFGLALQRPRRALAQGAAGRDGTLRSLKLKLGTRLGLTEPVFKLGDERADPNSGKLGLADWFLEVENLALKLRMISKSSAYPTPVSLVQVLMTESGV